MTDCKSCEDKDWEIVRLRKILAKDREHHPMYHHCMCMWYREHAGKTVNCDDGEKQWSEIVKDPGYCAECEGTGWCT